MTQNNTQAQRDELEITGKVQFTQKRDPMRAGNDAGEIAIFSVLFAGRPGGRPLQGIFGGGCVGVGLRTTRVMTDDSGWSICTA